MGNPWFESKLLTLLSIPFSSSQLTNASTRFATLGILGFFEFPCLSGKFRLDLHGSKRVMQAL
ncbi:hypothetical protein ERW51_18625, partial [Aliivibrio finisterrensis]